MTPVFLYITVPDLTEAKNIARVLVEERLVACANILENMHSVYRWKGEVHEDQEVAMVVKTRKELVEQVTQRIISLHTYECPCVVALPIEGGNPAYLDWLEAQTKSVE